MVSTPLKNIRQNGNLPQIGVKYKIFESTCQTNLSVAHQPISSKKPKIQQHHLLLALHSPQRALVRRPAAAQRSASLTSGPALGAGGWLDGHSGDVCYGKAASGTAVAATAAVAAIATAVGVAATAVAVGVAVGTAVAAIAAAAAAAAGTIAAAAATAAVVFQVAPSSGAPAPSQAAVREAFERMVTIAALLGETCP